ncbi:hypothetical protein NP233_g10226 [Leucocoprinus birnbaumii]|uniref:Uncharacterized protein n=1 Tax=Leucocoprinus birnbaumii TaxID=56174 RepID=A0AAD5YS37_9AGAR|nr:hypothetical protein NP233_g10226 [Leucocoprinus birnbaumii]
MLCAYSACSCLPAECSSLVLHAECEVTKEEYQDPLLAASYTSLPALVEGHFNSWSSLNNGPDPIAFSSWALVAPDLHFSNALNSVMFVSDAQYINPSHVKTGDEPNKYKLAVCMTAVCVTKRSVLEVSSPPKLANASSPPHFAALHPTDDVPVYDACAFKDDINYSTGFFNKMPTTFPCFHEEIPTNSFAVLGYMVLYWQSTQTGAWNISANIQWILLLATPDCGLFE